MTQKWEEPYYEQARRDNDFASSVNRVRDSDLRGIHPEQIRHILDNAKSQVESRDREISELSYQLHLAKEHSLQREVLEQQEEILRLTNPALKDAWDAYHTTLSLVKK